MNTHSKSRRGALIGGAALVGSLAMVSVRVAAQKSSKASLLYQDHPHEGKKCAECKYFSAAGASSDAGTCALVEGPVQPSGWCLAFSARQ